MKYDTKKRKKKINNKTRKQFLFNPKNPKTSFDVYIDKNPMDTINIKYTTIEDVKNTIDKLEKLYKTKKYTHKRIWQVGMIMYVRLHLRSFKTPPSGAVMSDEDDADCAFSMRKGVKVLRYKKPKQFALAKKYFNFLGKRTKIEEESRYTLSFTY